MFRHEGGQGQGRGLTHARRRGQSLVIVIVELPQSRTRDSQVDRRLHSR